jgi:hypothetical protein
MLCLRAWALCPAKRSFKNTLWRHVATRSISYEPPAARAGLVKPAADYDRPPARSFEVRVWLNFTGEKDN